MLQPLPTHHAQGLHGLISVALSPLMTSLVSERLSQAGMKIKPDDGKQKSMTYSSESEDSEHSLVGGVIQYMCYIFSILVSSLHAELTDWLTDWLIDWSIDRSIDRLTIDWLIDWLINWMIDWLIDWSVDWLTDWLIDWLIDWAIDWVIDLAIDVADVV